jgi:hypothetical protein
MSCIGNSLAVTLAHIRTNNLLTAHHAVCFTFALSLMVLAANKTALANETDYKCPRKIAYVENEPMSQRSIVILQKLYADLGCPLEAIALPGRRGPLHFNEGLVDGELYRATAAEKNYARAFARSSVPLREISNRLWRNPNDNDPKTPIAFTLGVTWQEQFVNKNTARTGVTHKPMMYNTEKYEAYANGQITRFLSADNNVEDMIAQDMLGNTPAPVIEETISILPLYHYLGAEYAPFMRKFSELVAATQPFRSPQVQ